LNRDAAGGDFVEVKRSDGCAEQQSTETMEKLTIVYAAWACLGFAEVPRGRSHLPTQADADSSPDPFRNFPTLDATCCNPESSLTIKIRPLFLPSVRGAFMDL
jgi:hypothetical protein